MTRTKVAHARKRPLFQVGLFGNSGSLVVSADDIGLRTGEFFNFSVGGASLRHSVSAIEELARQGTIPKTVLVTFDHVETQFIGNAHYPAPPRRWLNAARDVTEGVRRSVSIRDLRLIVERNLRIEWGLFRNGLSYDHMRRSVANWIPALEPMIFVDPSSPTWESGYAEDGSRLHRLNPALPGQVPILRRRPRLVIPQYLDLDLERLAKVAQRTGSRIIVFEGLIDLKNAQFFADSPSAHAGATRSQFLLTCSRTGLECYAAPVEATSLTGPVEWENGNHPPAAVLGRYLAQLLRGERKVRDP